MLFISDYSTGLVLLRSKTILQYKTMKINRKISIILLLSLSVTIVAATNSSTTQEAPQYTNLKVLPKNISSKDLQKIMVDDFEDGLGVSCNFCHAANKTDGQLDYASDAKPEKEIARQMMRTTIGINKKYFKVKHPMIGSDALTVTCNTCHNGVAFPDGK
ncbi:MAG TPA: c-type cytochrome [Mucilaginibacter sp.]|nr:c-type cytochrome [Mucilaginibacter sp.]